jgi:hypothetical protein
MLEKKIGVADSFDEWRRGWKAKKTAAAVATGSVAAKLVCYADGCGGWRNSDLPA